MIQNKPQPQPEDRHLDMASISSFSDISEVPLSPPFEIATVSSANVSPSAASGGPANETPPMGQNKHDDLVCHPEYYMREDMVNFQVTSSRYRDHSRATL